MFPAPGAYTVGVLSAPLAKAATTGGEEADEFENWWLRAIEQRTRQEFVSAEQAMWGALETLLHERGVSAPSALAPQELQRTLFDLGTASTAHMVGFTIPAALSERLGALGFTTTEALNFPALAYRVGLIYRALEQSPPLPWSALVQRAHAMPLSSAERAAIEIARNRAGLWLRPIFDQAGQAWTAQREIEPLRRVLTAGLERRASTGQMVRELARSQRAQGILRDADRTLRTELAECRTRGAWDADSKHAPADAQWFRQLSANPCRGCLFLQKNSDGTPKLYTRQQILDGDALGYNTGHWTTWHVRLGGNHPRCVDAPWAVYHPAMASIFEGRAPGYAEMMRRLKVFEVKEAA